MIISKLEDYERIQDIIDTTRKQLYYEPETDIRRYEELFELSKSHKYAYGQAIACIKLAQCYQIINQTEEFQH